MFFLTMMDYPMFFLFMSNWKNFGHLPDSQGWTGLVSEPCWRTPPLSKLCLTMVGGPQYLSDSPDAKFPFSFLAPFQPRACQYHISYIMSHVVGGIKMLIQFYVHRDRETSVFISNKIMKTNDSHFLIKHGK